MSSGGGSPPTEHIPKSPLKFEFQPITEAQVLKIITKLANGKATGSHDIPNRALMNCAEKITPSLSYIFNLSVKTRVFLMMSRLQKLPQFLKMEIKVTRETTDLYQSSQLLPGVLRN